MPKYKTAPVATTIEYRIGKIRDLSSKTEVRVSLFTDPKMSRDSEEVVGELPRKYFPNGVKLEVGDVFNYETSVKIDMVKKRVPTNAQIKRMRKEVEKMLPKGEY